MATPKEIARARGLLTTRLPGMPPMLPTAPAPAPALPAVPMSPEQADAASMLGIAPPSMPGGAPAPDYDPAVHGRVTGIVPTTAPLTPDQMQARQMLAQRAAPSLEVGPITMSRPGPQAAPVPRPAAAAAAAPRVPTATERRKADEKQLVASYGTEQEAMRRANNAELTVAVDGAERTRAMGNEMEARAAEEAAIQRDYDGERRAYREQTHAMVESLRKREVDPQRLYGKPSIGSSIAIALGGALAGMYAGMQGRAGNDFVATLDRNIERDIAAQEGQIANEKAALGERQNLYGQMISAHKDSTLARLQTKNALLEAAKVQLDSEAQRLGTDVSRANADRAIGLIGRQQTTLQRDLDAAEEQAAARAAAARAAAIAAREKMMFERGVKLEELRQGNRKLDIEEQGKEGGMAGRFVATGNDPATGAPTGYVARDKESASKAEEGLAATNNALAITKRILKNREEQGKLGRFTSRGDGSFLGTPEWKTQNRSDAALLMTELNRASKAGALDAGALEILKQRVKDPNALDLLGDETSDAYRQLETQLTTQAELAKRGSAGQLVEKRIDERGREVIVPTGHQLAPSNARAVQRYNADGSPKR